MRKFYIDTTSEAYKRVTQAGFSIDSLKTLENCLINGGGWGLASEFTCVCGKTEVLVAGFAPDINFSDEFIDVAAMIERSGALGEEHLREDGYTEYEIWKIRRPYNNLKEAA